MEPAQLVADCERLDSDRKNVEYQWDLIESYVMPNRGRFFTDLDSEEKAVDWRHRERFDDTAVFAAQSLAATIHSTLTNQAASWFGLKFRDPKLASKKEFAEWLQACTLHVHNIFTHSSNFHLEVSEFYHDDVGFGSASMLHEVEPGGKHKFKTCMVRECYFEESADGDVLRFYRKRKYSGLQIRDMFPDDVLPEAVLTEIEKPTGKKFTLYNCIYKNFKANPDDGSVIDKPEERQFLQKYVLGESKLQLGKTHGYYSMPVYFLRWARTAGSKWGYSQSMVVMGHILSLQELVSMTLTANELAIEPPVTATSRGVLGDIDLAARGVTYVESHDAIKEFMTGAKVEFGSMAVDQMQQVVRYAFFQDKLELRDSPAMTATEVNARMEQMQRFLGGAVIRAKSDFLDKLVERTFMEEYRGGRLPDMPEGLSLKDVDVEYVGALARLQRLDAVDSYRNWIGLIMEYAQVSPDVTDIPDFHKIIDDAGERLGVPAEARKSLSEAMDIKKAREEAQQKALEAATNKDQMGAANLAADAKNKEEGAR